MASVTKKVDRAVAPTKRSQIFTSADASEDDILMIYDSLGHSSAHISIEAIGGDMKVRFNVIRTVFPTRLYDGFFANGNWQNIASGVDIIGDGMGEVVVAAGESYELDRELTVDDIHLVTVSGTFSIFVS